MKSKHSLLNFLPVLLFLFLSSSFLIPGQAHATMTVWNSSLNNINTDIPTKTPTPALCGGVWSNGYAYSLPGVGTLTTPWSSYSGGTDPLCSGPAGVVLSTPAVSLTTIINFIDSTIYTATGPGSSNGGDGLLVHYDPISGARACYLIDTTSSFSSSSGFNDFGSPKGNYVEYWNPSANTWQYSEASDSGSLNGGANGYNSYISPLVCTTNALPASTLSVSATSVTAGTPVTISWNEGPNADAESTVSTASGFTLTNHLIYSIASVTHNNPPNVATTICTPIPMLGGNICIPEYGAPYGPSLDPVSPTTQVPDESGSVTVTPTATTQYCYSSTNGNGTTKVCKTVTVNPASLPNLTAGAVSPTTAVAGTASTYSATITNIGTASTGVAFTDILQSALDSSGTGAAQVASYANSILAANGTTNATFSYTYPSSGTYYMRACADSGDVVTESNSTDQCGSWTAITVAPIPVPTSTLSASPTSISTGGSSTLTWSSTKATSCSIDNGVGTVTPTSGGSVPVSPASATTYTITCTGAGGSSTASATVSVSGIADLTAGATSPATAIAGTPVALTASASNPGNAASGSFPSIFEINNAATTVGTNSVSLVAGASAPITASYTFATPGSYQVRACANMNTSMTNIVTESNYGNNCGGWETLTVSYPAPGGTCSASPATVTAGSSVTWTATPSGGAGPGTYTYQWSGNVSGTSQSETQPYPSAGTYTGTVVISSNGQNYTAQCSPGNVTSPVTVVSCVPTLSANPSTVAEGGSSQLSWSEPTQCSVSSCVFSDGYTGGLSGVHTVYPPIPSSGNTDNYSVTCGIPANTANTAIQVNIPTIHLTATPTRVSAPSTVNAITLKWNSTNTNACTITRPGEIVPGTTGTTGSVTDPLPISAQTIYTATCTTGTALDPGTPVTATALVNVVPSFQEF